LPYEDGIKQAERLYKILDKTEMKEAVRKELKGIVALNMYDEEFYRFYTDSLVEDEVVEAFKSGLGKWSSVKKPSEIPELRWGAGDGGNGDFVEKTYDLVRLWSAGHLSEKQIDYLNALLFDKWTDPCERVDKELERAWNEECDSKN